MRSLSITALMILAAFVLGLTLGGQAPREVSAAQEQLPAISWKSNGETLVITNNTTDKGFLVRGSFLASSDAEVPPSFVAGILELPQRDLDGVVISRIEPALACDHLSCRSCDDAPTLCEMPPRPIPFIDRQILSTMGRRIW